MKVKAIAVDVDGTITDARMKLSLKAISAIRRLEASGIRVILASGNTLCVVKTLATYIGCSGACICEGGGVVEYRGEIRKLGSRNLAMKALAKLKKLYGNAIEESWSNPYRLVDVAFHSSLSMEELSKALKRVKGVKLLFSGFAYHLVDASVDKGRGLRVASDLMDIDLDEVVAVGDSDVDIELLKASGLGVALGNAPRSLKRVADVVIVRSYGEGFAKFGSMILKGKLELRKR